MQEFRLLGVSKKARAVALDVYRETTSFPADERFGLTAQMRRATVSIGSNIAEGCGRGTQADFGHFIQMAIGSASELEFQLDLAHDLDYLGDTEYETLLARVIEVREMAIALQKKLR